MARYGLPDKVASDSDSLYTSRGFKAFAKDYGFKHVTTRPYHHQSNGKVVSTVKEAKKILKKSATTLMFCHSVILPFIQEHDATLALNFSMNY